MNLLMPLIVRNTFRNRRRSALTVASLAISLCLLGLLLALSRALFFGPNPTPGEALRIVVHHKIALTQDLPVSDETKISRIPGVHSVTSLRWFGGTYKDDRDPKNHFGQFAIEPHNLFDVYPELRIPHDQRRAFIEDKTACVASRVLADRLGWRLGERITLVGGVTPATLELKLAGIFDGASGNTVLYFNREYLHDSLPANDIRRDMVQQYYVEADNKESVARIARQIDATFEESPYPTKSEPEQAFMLGFVSFLGNLKLFLAAICGAVTFTILLVSGNMLSISVRDRTREIGILKTLGFAPVEILGIIAGEATAIALVAGVLGCALAAALCQAIGNVMRSAPGFASVIRGLSVTPAVALLTLSIAAVVAAASSVVPGWNAARASILDALGYNG
jgi:putative ABC transport system permease protein